MATTHIHRNQFLRNLEKCGLFDHAELREIARTLPSTDRGRVLARYLVQDGTLTKFQAENLLANRTNGFVLGQYKILEELGKGGMGRVFKAEHMTMGRVVALKVLAASLTRTEKARQLFQREVRAAGKLVHPHIVTAFDANRVGERYFLVLEYIDGPTLSSLVRDQGPLPIGQACEFVRQAALGLQHAHALGMVHRDIKPSNLLVQPPLGATLEAGGVVKITDFGLARLSDADEPRAAPREEASDDSIFAGPQQVMGTPDYLSPEQGRNLDDADIRSDLYSLGCSFYFLLTGEVPFPGGSALEKLVRHATVDAEPVEDLRPAVPARVAGLVRAMMAKDPAARPQTPLELADALEPFAEVRPVVWHRPNDSLLSTTSTIDLLASPEGQSTTGASVLSGTHSRGDGPTALSAAELQALKAGTPRRWSWLQVVLVVVAVALGFAVGVFTIGGGLTGRN